MMRYPICPVCKAVIAAYIKGCCPSCGVKMREKVKYHSKKPCPEAEATPYNLDDFIDSL